jgi:hypothetical protein
MAGFRSFLENKGKTSVPKSERRYAHSSRAIVLSGSFVCLRVEEIEIKEH